MKNRIAKEILNYFKLYYKEIIFKKSLILPQSKDTHRSKE